MSTPQPSPDVHVISGEVLADAHQLKELLVGVVALLLHPHRHAAVDAARAAALEARAVADRVVEQLEAHAVIAAGAPSAGR